MPDASERAFPLAAPFEALLDVLGATFYRCEASAPWRMAYLSQAAEGLTGRSRDTLRGQAWQELMHPADVARVEQAVTEAVATNTPFAVTYRIRHASGALRWVREQGQAVVFRDGTPSFLVGMLVDITAERRLRAETAAARRSVARHAEELANVLESTSDCIYSLNRAWEFTYLNSRAQAELRPAEELLGRHILEVSPQLGDTPFGDAFAGALEARTPGRVEAYMPGLEHWYEVTVAPTAGGITAFFRNVDARKRAEAAAARREDRLRRTIDSIPHMVWASGPDGAPDYYSRAWHEFTGVASGATEGAGWEALFHPADRPGAEAAWRRSLETGERYDTEYRLRHHSGAFRWVRARAAPERDASGRIVRWYGTCSDVHDRVRAEGALQENRSLKQSVFDASADCIKILAPDGTLEFMNDPGLAAMEIETIDQVRGRDWVSFWDAADQAAVREAIAGALAGHPRRLTGVVPTASGTRKWWDEVITPIPNEQGAIARLLSISRDVTAHREVARQLQWASDHDALTELPNRRAFKSHLQAAVLRAMQTGAEVALLLVDLDHFKHVNDTLGHPAGDHLLKAFARRLSGCVRSTDFVARLGGDEFAVVLESGGEAFDPVALGETIVERLRHPVVFEGRTLGAGASMGGALFPRDGESAGEVLKSADIALYALKEAGRGGIRMFHSDMRQDAQIKASQLSLARMALTGSSVEPHYQQKVDLRSGCVAGLEALLRWRHDTRGLQLPDTVAEAFNDYELASKIGDLMQHKVLADLRTWLDRGLDVGFVAINAAPAEFLRDDFAERLLARVEEHAIPPSLIEVEVTEHVFLGRSTDYVARALTRLDAAGIRIALDDFGTGHSSLSHLRDFPVDVVKIDRSFVQRMAADTEVRAIVSAVVKLAQSLRIEVVAEGVETRQHVDLLLADGCRLGQGFFFGKAIGADQVPRLFRSPARRMVA
jgi:diguanylate cyclase (GGDEF)-like protein/PAS domain S-box-containing protein